jgi:hypothetical protein
MLTNVDVQIKKTISNIVASCGIPPNEEVHYKIYNSSRKLVFSKSIIMINTDGKVLEDLDVSHLPHGNYQLDISTGTNKPLKKIDITI